MLSSDNFQNLTCCVIFGGKSIAEMAKNISKKRRFLSDDESESAVDLAREIFFPKKPKLNNSIDIGGDKSNLSHLESQATLSKGDIEIEVVDVIPGKSYNDGKEDIEIVSVDKAEVMPNIEKQIEIVAFIPGAVECKTNGQVDVVSTGSTQDEPINVLSESDDEDDALTLVYSASDEDTTESADEVAQNQLMDRKVRDLYDHQFNGM